VVETGVSISRARDRVRSPGDALVRSAPVRLDLADAGVVIETDPIGLT
jgi:hypothetical protein